MIPPDLLDHLDLILSVLGDELTQLSTIGLTIYDSAVGKERNLKVFLLRVVADMMARKAVCFTFHLFDFYTYEVMKVIPLLPYSSRRFLAAPFTSFYFHPLQTTFLILPCGSHRFLAAPNISLRFPPLSYDPFYFLALTASPHPFTNVCIVYEAGWL